MLQFCNSFLKVKRIKEFLTIVLKVEIWGSFVFFLVEEQTSGRSTESPPRSSRGSTNISTRCSKNNQSLSALIYGRYVFNIIKPLIKGTLWKDHQLYTIYQHQYVKGMFKKASPFWLGEGSEKTGQWMDAKTIFAGPVLHWNIFLEEDLETKFFSVTWKNQI